MERLRYKMITALLHFVFISWMYACSDEEVPGTLHASANLRTAPPKTENVILVVIDGPRYSDTWAPKGQPYIPYMAHTLAPQGTLFTNFQNEGPTYTMAGHTALITGNYQNINNSGKEHPSKPTIFQHYLQQKELPPHKAAIITSKLKLNMLSDCRDIGWRGRFNPSVSSGKGSTDRKDAETLEAAINTLQEKQPGLVLIQFKGPDANGHAGNWTGYLKSLQETDSLVNELWQYVQQDEHYKDKTAILITNDHGRHADGHKDGFISHGDKCSSCKHISLLALGPDFVPGAVIKEKYHQAEVPATIGRLLGIQVPTYHGSDITPLTQPAVQ
jgi:hypothetical protein